MTPLGGGALLYPGRARPNAATTGVSVSGGPCIAEQFRESRERALEMFRKSSS